MPINRRDCEQWISRRRAVDSATGYRFLWVCGRDTEIERSEVSPGLSEMYKIHLARFSGIDVERVTIYVSPFLHGEKRERETTGRRWPLGSRRNLIDRKRGWDIGSEIGFDRWSVTVLTLAYREIRIQPVLADTGLSQSFLSPCPRSLTIELTAWANLAFCTSVTRPSSSYFLWFSADKR